MQVLTPQFWRDEPEPFSSEQLFKIGQIMKKVRARARKPYLKQIEDYKHKIARTQLELDLHRRLLTAIKRAPFEA